MIVIYNSNHNKLMKIKGHSDQLAQIAASTGQNGGNVIIGDYEIPADKNGNVSGGFKINSFRPYLGLGESADLFLAHGLF